MSWLEAKVEKTMKALEARKVHVSLNCASATNYTSKSDSSDEERKLYAFELIESYLKEDLASELRAHLR